MNVPRPKHGKMTFVISKMQEDNELKKEIRTSFEDVDKYLKVNPSMVIG
jgi:hypothetical protein